MPRERRLHSSIFALVAVGLALVPVVARGAALADHPSVAGTQPDELKPETVHYRSAGLDLVGYLFRPQGSGPFPVYLWNHGSERDPHTGALLARFLVPHGFVLFAPIRSGQGPNPGEYILEREREIPDRRSAEGFQRVDALHERANDDVAAAYDYISHQGFVDPRRIVVAGGSYGGIQTLLMAERDGRARLGVRCFVAMAPAAQSWDNPNWAARLSTAITDAHAPIFLLQAENDYNLGPSKVLGPLIDAKGFPNRHRIFPPHGDPADHAMGHGGFFSDAAAWGPDVLAFLHDCGAM